MKRRVIIDLLALHKDKGYGFQQYILNLLDYFYDHRSEIPYDEIIIVCRDAVSELLVKYSDRFKIKAFSVNNYLSRLWLQTYLPFYMRLHRKDLLVSPGNTSGLIKKCTEVLVIHDLLFKRKEWLSNKLMRLQRGFYIPISLKKADRIIAISHYTADDIARYYPSSKKKLTVIYNSINWRKFHVYNGERLINGDFFLAVSTNAQYKNQITILKAFNQYVEGGGLKRLVLIGAVSPLSEVGEMLIRLPDIVRARIEIKTNISNQELGWYYRNASCYISASLFEGFGMPVVEAMSFDCPVLLSDTAIHREVSMNLGEYFNPMDDKELSNKMMKMNFSRRSYSSDIRRKYSEEETSAKYVNLFSFIHENSI